MMKRTNPAERWAKQNMQPHMPPSLNCSDDSARKSGTAAVLKNDTVIAAVRQVGEGFKARVKAQLVSMYHSYIEQWTQKCAERPGKTDPHTFWPCHGNLNRSVYRSNERMRSMTRIFLDSRPRPAAEWMNETGPMIEREQHIYFLKPADEIAEIIERRSEKEAEAAIQNFVAKMTAKLFGILDAKGDFKAVTVYGTLGQNTMRFSFADGSSFDLVNDIIINQSCLGKVFNQYPTRFSNVKLLEPSSCRFRSRLARNFSLLGDCGLASVSEAWMKRNFKAGAGKPVTSEMATAQRDRLRVQTDWMAAHPNATAEEIAKMRQATNKTS